ncbi:GDCCVxC domain-containing (seleno)protein [Polaromonas sp. AET17H-212]|nr:GDCCVxC domain-containing (seleno)protein [Polaromonas sp. AET17H-212]
MAAEERHRCEQCHAVLNPKARDCCVFCSSGTMPSPPIRNRSLLLNSCS